MSRQGRPVGLIIAVVAVTAAALLLWTLMKSGDEDASASTAQPQPQPQPQPTDGSGAPARRAVARDDGERPGVPQVADSGEGRRAGSSDDLPYTETIINGVRVRDHRRDRSKPVEITPRPRPEQMRRLPPNLTRDISNHLLPIVRECAGNAPPEARGTKPRVDGEVAIAIKNQQVQITRAAVELSEVFGAAVEATKRCIEQKAVGVTMPVGDEADLENYPIRITFSLP